MTYTVKKQNVSLYPPNTNVSFSCTDVNLAAAQCTAKTASCNSVALQSVVTDLVRLFDFYISCSFRCKDLNWTSPFCFYASGGVPLAQVEWESGCPPFQPSLCGHTLRRGDSASAVVLVKRCTESHQST